MKRRRDISVFGLSFLDVMFCGFGSVILLVMIINSDTLAQRKAVQQDLRGEVMRLDTEVRAGEETMAEIRNALEDVDRERVVAHGRTRKVLSDIEETTTELAALEKITAAHREHINRLQSDLRRADAEKQRLSSEREDAERRGRSVRQFIGEGDRQYLTGLKVGGERILILVDASASMLDETIVNIIRLRNMSDEAQRRAAKWQRALYTVEWLISQLPVDSRFQVVAFNVDAVALAADGTWMEASKSSNLNQVMAKLNRLVPAGGTSLYKAFEHARGLAPRPDNVILLTDGLPTIGQSGQRGGRVSGKKRLDYFRQALRMLPAGMPVNSILFPIEGDPYAPSEFWKLAVSSGGSFMSPSKDWP
jgi:Mg-chelatase subunit ChlD